MIYAVNDANTGVYGVATTTGEKCLALFTDFQQAWRVAMAQTKDAAVLELTNEEAVELLKEAKKSPAYNRVTFDPEPKHLTHGTFDDAIRRLRRTGARI